MTEGLGYSREVYDTIAQFGLTRGAAILDVGCGGGIASAPFIQNGFPVAGVDISADAVKRAKEHFADAAFVWGKAESLPFPDERFDLVISAQSFDLFDRAIALSQAHRVLRSGGTLAVWWKQLMAQEPLKKLRGQAFHDAGEVAPAMGLSGGFREFYASEFIDQALRVVPARDSEHVMQVLEDERSRGQRYHDALARLLRGRYGSENPQLSVASVQYLYLAKKR